MPKFLLKTAIIAGITLGLLSYGVPLGATAPAAAVPVGADASPDSLDANRDLTDVSEDTTLHLEVGNQTDDPVLTSNPQTTPVSAAALSFRAINQDTGVVPQAKLKAEFAAKHPQLEYEKLPQWGFANLRISVRASGNQAYSLPARFSIHQTGGNAYLAAYRLRDNTAEPILDNGNGIASKYFVTSQNANYNFSGKDGDIIQLLAVGKGLVTCEVDPIYNPTDENNASFGKTFTLTVNATGKHFADLQPEDLVPPGEQPQTVPNKPGIAQLRHGHLDVFHVEPDENNNLRLLIKEDITGEGVHRAAESAEMIIGTNWYQTGLDWKLPGCENAGFTSTSLVGEMLSPGLSSSGLDSAGFSDVKVEFTSVNAPPGGRIALVLTSSLQGGPQPILEDNRYYIEPGTRLRITTHQHFHWLFTKPGTYRFTAKAIAKLAGKPVESPEATYTWITESTPEHLDPVGIDPHCTPHEPGHHNTSETTTPEKPDTPNPDHPKETITSRPVFNHGHLDLFNVQNYGDKLVLETKEDITGSEVIRAPETFFLQVKNNTITNIPLAVQTGIIPQGYLLQENGSQQETALFPGWDTNGADQNLHPIDITFPEITGPGKVFLFFSNQTGSGKTPALFSSQTADTPDTYELAANRFIRQKYRAHKHVYWLFEKPGIYTMKAQAWGKTPDGKLVKSNVGTYIWAVGDETAIPPIPPGDSTAELKQTTPKKGKTNNPAKKLSLLGADLVGASGKTSAQAPHRSGKNSATKRPKKKPGSLAPAPKRSKKTTPAPPRHQESHPKTPHPSTRAPKTTGENGTENASPPPLEQPSEHENDPTPGMNSTETPWTGTMGFPPNPSLNLAQDATANLGVPREETPHLEEPNQTQPEANALNPAPTPPERTTVSEPGPLPYGSARITKTSETHTSVCAVLTGAGLAAGATGMLMLGLRWRKLRLRR